MSQQGVLRSEETLGPRSRDVRDRSPSKAFSRDTCFSSHRQAENGGSGYSHLIWSQRR